MKIRNLFILISVIIFISTAEGNDNHFNYDIIIAGGGMGGTGAAIQASRMGMKVLIIEPTYMLGGQSTAAGVSTMDDMSGIESGIYLEFINKVREYYSKLNKSISTAYWKNYTRAFEPSVGHEILAEMTKSADILYHSSIVRVNIEDKSLTVKTPEGTENINFKILIDATEYGDILPLAGVKYRAGNSISPETSKDVYIQDITWTTVIRKYPKGVPENLMPKNPLPGYEKAKKNYEGYVAKNGFDFQGKYPVKLPVNLISHNAYRAIPDSYTKINYTGDRKDWWRIMKTGVNWANDYPGMYLWKGHYGLTAQYLENPELRKQIEKEALLKTLHFIYYVQNELKENWSVDENEYGELPEIAKELNLSDDWKEIAKHFPPIPYVRESRRIVGTFTLNSSAIYKNSMSWRMGNKNNEFNDAIAIGGYNMDLHGGDDDDDIESELGENQAAIYKHMPQGAFQVPMKILIPESVDNFIAAEKNLSMSRLASSALRLQPICMMTGQAAGALASVAIQNEIQPREVKAFDVQKRLVDDGVVISLCSYTDVPRGHKFYNSVQLATVHNLIQPKVTPNLPSKNINSGKKGQKKHKTIKGRFGINDRVTEKEFADMIEKAEKIAGKKLNLEFNSKMTKGEAVNLIVDSLSNTRPSDFQFQFGSSL